MKNLLLLLLTLVSLNVYSQEKDTNQLHLGNSTYINSTTMSLGYYSDFGNGYFFKSYNAYRYSFEPNIIGDYFVSENFVMRTNELNTLNYGVGYIFLYDNFRGQWVNSLGVKLRVKLF